MVVQETLRLYTIIPFVNRVAASDHVWTDDNGVVRTIRKGTVLLVALSSMNRDPNNWDDPNSFVPERFCDYKGHCSAKARIPAIWVRVQNMHRQQHGAHRGYSWYWCAS